MLCKTAKPMIKILMGSITNHHQMESSSKNHQSPKGLRSFDLGGVGLGIVVALEKSRPANKALFSRNLSRSKPVPVDSTRGCEEMDSLEEYNIVTCHGPKESCTKVYRTTNGAERVRNVHDQRLQSSSAILKNKRASSVFHISPAKSSDFSRIPTSDFLSSCNMCQKKLHGKDVYMYRGEKGFCSAECRYNQIVIDERKEKYCSTEASRQAVDVSSSPYATAANGQMFTTGILAT